MVKIELVVAGIVVGALVMLVSGFAVAHANWSGSQTFGTGLLVAGSGLVGLVAATVVAKVSAVLGLASAVLSALTLVAGLALVVVAA